MSVTTTTQRVQYTGDTTTTLFSFSFRVYASTDITVYTTTSGVDNLNVLTTDYSVTVNATTASPGGSITMVTAPGSDTTVTMYRDLSQVQSTAYTVGGPFPAAAHEQALDKLTLMVQDLSERIDRRIPDYDVTSSGTAAY